MLFTIAGEEPLPARFIAGADAVATAGQMLSTLQQQINPYRDLQVL